MEPSEAGCWRSTGAFRSSFLLIAEYHKNANGESTVLVQNRAKTCLIVSDRHRYGQIWTDMFRMHVLNHHATYMRSNAYENATISFCKSLTDSYNIMFPPASCIDQALYSTTASSLVLWAEVHVSSSWVSTMPGSLVIALVVSTAAAVSTQHRLQPN